MSHGPADAPVARSGGGVAARDSAFILSLLLLLLSLSLLFVLVLLLSLLLVVVVSQGLSCDSDAWPRGTVGFQKFVV